MPKRSEELDKGEKNLPVCFRRQTSKFMENLDLTFGEYVL